MNIRYVVLNENTLGYMAGVWDTFLLMGVLHGSVMRGGHDWKNGPVLVVPGSDKVRTATAADFRNYRVCLPYDFQEPDGLSLYGNWPEGSVQA